MSKDICYYDDSTLEKVRHVLEKYLEFKSNVDDIFCDLFNEGILFRERIKEVKVNGD